MRRGFTVVESAMAVLVATLLLTMAWGLFVRVTTTGRTTSEKVCDLSSAITVLSYLEKDLKAAASVEAGTDPAALLTLHAAPAAGHTAGPPVVYGFDRDRGVLVRDGRSIRMARLDALELVPGEEGAHAWVEVRLAVRDVRSDPRAPVYRRYTYRLATPGRGTTSIASLWNANVRLESL